ncbi:MAG: hypothetical protein ABFD15_07680 [Methanofastidiosum sp.]
MKTRHIIIFLCITILIGLALYQYGELNFFGDTKQVKDLKLKITQLENARLSTENDNRILMERILRMREEEDRLLKENYILNEQLQDLKKNKREIR